MAFIPLCKQDDETNEPRKGLSNRRYPAIET